MGMDMKWGSLRRDGKQMKTQLDNRNQQKKQHDKEELTHYRLTKGGSKFLNTICIL